MVRNISLDAAECVERIVSHNALQEFGKVLLTEEQVRKNLQASLEAAAARPLFTGTAVSLESTPISPRIHIHISPLIR